MHARMSQILNFRYLDRFLVRFLGSDHFMVKILKGFDECA